jgi:flavin-binding protein dodecin
MAGRVHTAKKSVGHRSRPRVGMKLASVDEAASKALAEVSDTAHALSCGRFEDWDGGAVPRFDVRRSGPVRAE